jgi:hypothetical protein
MDFDEQEVDLLIEYHKAHLLWKSLPDGPERTAAKRERGRLHGQVIKLCRLVTERKPP